MTASDFRSALRPSCWVYNALVLVPPVFSLQMIDRAALARSAGAFVAFCFASSSAYVWNDIFDTSRDAHHPDKCGRPIAAGRIPPPNATALALSLASAAISVAGFVGLGMVLCVSAFLTLQAAYTIALKHVAIVDVVAIASAFVLRAAAGVVATRTDMSVWLFFESFLVAILLALAMRRSEILVLGENAANHRPVLEAYRGFPLDVLVAVCAVAVIAIYVNFTLSSDVAQRFGTDRLWLSVPFVVFAVFRYLFLVYGRDQGGNPAEALLGDAPLLIAVALWAATVVELMAT